MADDPNAGGQVLQPVTIATIALAVGFKGDDLLFITRAALGESSGRTAVTHPNSNGTTDYGLMQINSSHKDILPNFFPPSTVWQNPVSNMKAAKVIFDAQGRQAWVSSSAGQDANAAIAAQAVGQLVAHPPAQEVLDTLAKSGSITGIPTDGSGQTATEVGGKIPDIIGGLFDGLGPPLWIAGGCVLVLLGVVLLAKDTDIGQAAIGAAKVAAL